MTIHKHLDQAGLGKKYDRWLALEQLGAESPQKQANELPSWKGIIRNLGKAMCSAPGELLNQETFYVGRLKGVGKVYLHAVVDTYSSYALGFLHFNKGAEGAVAVLDNDVLPFYEKHSIKVENILTDNGTAFKGTQTHPYQIYLELNDIKDRTTQVRSPQRNGFIETF